MTKFNLTYKKKQRLLQKEAEEDESFPQVQTLQKNANFAAIDAQLQAAVQKKNQLEMDLNSMTVLYDQVKDEIGNLQTEMARLKRREVAGQQQVSCVRSAYRAVKAEKEKVDCGISREDLKMMEEIAQHLLKNLGHEEKEDSPMQADDQKMGSKGKLITSILNRCLDQANKQNDRIKQAEDAATISVADLAVEKQERKQSDMEASTVQKRLEADLEAVQNELTEAKKNLLLAQNIQHSLQAEEKQKQKQQDEFLNKALESAKAEIQQLKHENKDAQTRMSKLQGSLKEAVVKSMALPKTQKELEKANGQVEQLQSDLRTEKWKREGAEARVQELLQQQQAAKDEEDEDDDEILDVGRFGLTQMVADFSTKADPQGESDSKRVRDLMSEARRALEKKVNTHLRTRLGMHNAQIKDKSLTLLNKMKLLETRGGFPQQLLDAMHKMRQMGNAATHDRDLPSRAEVEGNMREFTRLEALFEKGQLHSSTFSRLPRASSESIFRSKPSGPRTVRWG